jgi:hypothetical protein
MRYPIPYAAEYTPTLETPKKKPIIYRSLESVIQYIILFGTRGRVNRRYVGIFENDGREKPICFIIIPRAITNIIKDENNAEKTTPYRPYPKNTNKTIVNII